VHATIVGAGSQEGVGDLLEMIRDGVGKTQDGVGGSMDVLDPSLQKMESTTSGVEPSNPFVAVPGGLGEVPDGLGVSPGRESTRGSPPMHLAPVGGRWVLYQDPPLYLLDVLRGQPQSDMGWQQAHYDGQWYGLLTPPHGRGGSGSSAPPHAYRYVTSPAELMGLAGEPDGLAGDPSCLGGDAPPPGICPPGHAWDPQSQQCIATSYGVIIDTYHHSDIAGTGAIPTGLGVSASQIKSDLQNAQAAAQAHTLITDDYSDAIGYCQAAAQAAYTAEQTLSSHPLLSDIGSQMGVIQKVISDGRTNSAAYGDAYQAASTAYTDFLTDVALPANQATPTPTPTPTPHPSPSPGPGPITPVTPPGPVATTSTSYAKPILITAGVAAASIVGYALYKRYYGKGKGASGARTRVPSGRTAHSARTVRA
jgi:hypothetical protein